MQEALKFQMGVVEFFLLITDILDGATNSIFKTAAKLSETMGIQRIF